MAKAMKSKQLSFEAADKVGLLSDVTRAIAAAKINVTAICAYGMERKANFMLITDGNAKAKKELTKLGITAQEEDVVSVELSNKSGEMQKVAKKIAEAGINIHYLYATASSGKTATAVFATNDNKKTIKVINAK
ncbi:MAG: ACT domain-containing protein [Nitrospirota bacterium]